MLLLLFLLGIHIGSFLNVCIWRMPRGESVVEPPSHCPKCDTRLGFLDLVPLVSQVVLRGRCRYCGARIAWRYFGVELLTGVLFVLVGMQPYVANADWMAGAATVAGPHLLRDLIFVSTLVVVFWIDYDTRLIQLEAVLLLGLAGVLYDAWEVVFRHTADLAGSMLFVPAPLPGSILAMVVTAGFLWLIRELFSWIYGREALGFGDVILVAAIAANLGWSTSILTFFFLSIVVGAGIAVLLQVPRAARAYLWTRRRQRRYGSRVLPWQMARHSFRKAIPFGPMLAAGAVAALLYGPALNQAYLNWANPGLAIGR